MSSNYGVDIALEYDDSGADIKGNSADIPLIDGMDNLAQAVRNRLMTAIGDNPRYPTYGSRLHMLIGSKSNAILDTVVRMIVMEALQNEGRMRLATDINVDMLGDTIDIAIYLVSIYSAETTVTLTIGGLV